MAKSTYYYEISKEDAVGKRNEDLLKLIKAIFKQHKQRYGVRRIYQELVNQGYELNHKRVQRLMHESGLSGIKPKKKYHSNKGTVGKIAENIISRDFKADKPLKKWTTDVSLFNFPWSRCYLSPFLDMATAASSYRTKISRCRGFPYDPLCLYTGTEYTHFVTILLPLRELNTIPSKKTTG